MLYQAHLTQQNSFTKGTGYTVEERLEKLEDQKSCTNVVLRIHVKEATVMKHQQYGSLNNSDNDNIS